MDYNEEFEYCPESMVYDRDNDVIYMTDLSSNTLIKQDLTTKLTTLESENIAYGTQLVNINDNLDCIDEYHAE